jgi:hypothetical protein
MAVRITSPTNGAVLQISDEVVFKGRADPDIKRVTLETPHGEDVFDLGTVNVTDGTWTFQRKFNTGGERVVIAEALDDEGDIIGSAQVQFTLQQSEFTPETLLPVNGHEKTSKEFREKVIRIAERIGANPNHLMAVMSFETGGSFSPKVKNAAGSGATGLIQFMASTAHGLGTSLSALEKMTAVDQLDFVERYFLPFKGKVTTLEDCYMAVLFPVAVGKPNSFVLFKSPTTTYKQNKGLDADKDGKVTKAEAAAKPRAILQKAGG